MNRAQIKCNGVHQKIEVNVDPSKNSVLIEKQTLALNELNLDAPITGTVYGTLLNYKGELDELGAAMYEAPYNTPPKAPILYIKPINTIIGNQKPIPMPNDMKEIQIGAALGIVIGKNAFKVSEENALEYVSGYTIVNDVSIPHNSFYRPAIKQKARDGFCPIGPWIIERDAILNPDNLKISVYINNILKQENSTSNLIRPVSRLISEISSFMTLYEGDTLLVGVPENPPIAKNGDQIRIEIEGIGSLENKVELETNYFKMEAVK